jgi:PAS domain S-box-containing protein
MPVMNSGERPTRADERLGFLFAVARDPMLILERGEDLESSVIVDCSNKAAKLFGYRRDTLIGKPLAFLEMPEPGPSARSVTSSFTDERRHRRADGQVLVLERTIQPIESGGRDFLLVSCRDVTTARLLERAILRVQQMDNVGVVSGTLVHDFRNLLVGILANAELALAGPQDEASFRSRVTEILHSARRATDIVDRVLPTGGGIEERFTLLDLNEVVRDSVALVGPSMAENLTIDVELAEADLRLFGDPTQLRQVVINLAINAAEALSPGAGKIRIKTGSMPASRIDFGAARLPITDPAPNWVYVDVTDSGSGIARSAIDRIFEPLFTTKPNGTGLGLTAVLLAVRRHQGTIILRSTPGKGATFRVLFPAHRER